MTQTRVLLIQDIDSLIVKIIPLIKLHASEFHIGTNEFDYFFDWAINQALVECYSMNVVHHYRHDIYICLYDIIKYDFIQGFKNCVNRFDMKILEGCQVKTLVNGRDLFITRRNSYHHFL